MSWSITVPVTPAPEFPAAVDEAREKANVPAQNQEAQEQADLACRIVKEIVASGLVGTDDHLYGAGMSGHANNPPVPGNSMNLNVFNAWPPKEV